MNQMFRDAKGRMLGIMEDQGGIIVIRDARGRQLGNYDKRMNVTRDSFGRMVGTGNLLTMLLK